MNESIAVLGIMLVCWIALIIADAALSGLVCLVSGIAYRSAFLWGLTALALPPLVIAYGSLWERNRFQVKEVKLGFENLPESFEGYRIVHISDIHARSFERREKHLQKAVDRINALKPDLIAFTGDLITLTPSELEGLTPILKVLHAEDGIVSVLGNHDYCQYADTDEITKRKYMKDLIESERAMGWTLLLNENVTIRRGTDSIAVVGVENISPSRHFPSKGNLCKASEDTEDCFRILLSHDPMHWDYEITGKHYPLTLSGHTHSMQISIFGWSPSSLIFKQHGGLYTKGNQHLYVNIGLGETIFPARIGARPEITLITVSKQIAGVIPR